MSMILKCFNWNGSKFGNTWGTPTTALIHNVSSSADSSALRGRILTATFTLVPESIAPIKRGMKSLLCWLIRFTLYTAVGRSCQQLLLLFCWMGLSRNFLPCLKLWFKFCQPSRAVVGNLSKTALTTMKTSLIVSSILCVTGINFEKLWKCKRASVSEVF